MPINTEGVEVVLEKKQIAPITSTSTGQAVTPPTTAPVVATGAFGANPTSTGENKAGFHLPPPIPAWSGPTVDPSYQFYMAIGYPQFAGRYAPFAIPTGYKVSGMVEQNNQLQVSFESTTRGISPSLMKNLEAFAVQGIQDQPSTIQTREVSPALMKNLEVFAVEGQQNLLDLQAKTASVASEAFKERVLESAKLAGRPEPVFSYVTPPKSDYEQLLESSPGAKRMYESAIAGGRPAPIFTLTTIATKQAAQIDQPFEQFPETGDPNDLVSWLNSQRTIGPNGEVIIPSGSVQKPSQVEAYQQYHDVRMPELLITESKTFYKGIGYPQYGGKYGTFNIPAGYRVLNISEQGGNLAVTFEVIPKAYPKGELGIAIRASEVIGGALTGIGQSIVKPFLEIGDIAQYNIAHPIQALGPELPFYPISLKEQQIFKERTDVSVFVLSTAAMIVAPPLIPLKLAGSIALGLGARTLVASGIGAGVGYYYNPTLEGAGVGALLGGATYLGTFAVTRGVTYAVQKSLQGSYETSVQAGELWKPSTLQKLGMAVTGAKPNPLPRSFVGLPTVEEGSLISAPYEETFIEGGQLATRTVIPSATQKWAGGLDVFDLTNAPRTSGYGYTEPTPIAPQIPEGGLPLISLSNALRPIPQGKLSFTKEPQTYRVAEESPLSFSKEYGELPTQTGLLEQITRQEAKMYPLSGPMENVFGLTAVTIQKTVTPTIPISLGDMTSWLLKQETTAKPIQTSAITPLSVTFQPQTRMKPLDETQFLTYPGQPLTVNVPTRETRETVVSPILDLGALNVLRGKQGAEAVQSLPLLEKQVQQITQPQKSLISNALISPLLESAVIQEQRTVSPLLTLSPLLSPLTESDISINLFPNVTPSERITPFTTQIITPGLSIPSPTPTKSILVPPRMPPVVTPKLFTLPKSGMGGLGPREPSSLLYPFGRQKRKYPVMTGGEAAKFLFSGKMETKRRKKK